MKRRSLLKNLFLGSFAGNVPLSSQIEAEDEDFGPDLCDKRFSLRFSDGCIDHDNVDISSFCKYKEYKGDNASKILRTIEFYKFREKMDVLSHEEECPHTHKPHYGSFGADGKREIEKTYLYKDGKKFESHPWKIRCIAYIGGSEIEVGVPESKPGKVWLRYTYDSVKEI